MYLARGSVVVQSHEKPVPCLCLSDSGAVLGRIRGEVNGRAQSSEGCNTSLDCEQSR